MFFLTNVTFILKFTPLFIHTIWSIGVEEQFYIFWPWLSMKNNQRFKNLILFVIMIVPFLKVLFLLLARVLNLSVFEDIYHIICVSKFDAMALGGLFALLYFEKKLTIFKFTMHCQFFYKSSVQIISYIAFLAYFLMLMFIDSRLGHFYPIFSFVTGIILMNLSTNKDTIISLENKILSSIGQVSYGVYLWHMPIIFMFYNYMHVHGTFQTYSSLSFFIHPIIMICVCAISYFSYYYFEVKFLKLKKRFAKILT
jgi:peptidoglycan/LPS O-acetylase OafA/YrhL